MKWVKLVDEMDPNISTAERKKFFETISSPKSGSGNKNNDFSLDLKEMLEKKGFEEWITYPATQSLSKKAARKYEIFCGGFLYYHDVEFKLKLQGKKFEHKIFFEWLPKGSAKKNRVRVYINSTPPEFNPNPPHPPPPPPPESSN